jgi:hypothetical protein
VFARTPDELEAELGRGGAALVLVDLTASAWDYEALFGKLGAAGGPVPILGFTTHVLARQTQPLHARCARVVTKETLTRELATILKEGIAA